MVVVIVGGNTVLPGGAERTVGLVILAEAVERGDWRTVRSWPAAGVDLRGHREAVHLALCLRLIAASMQKQSVGLVSAAGDLLDEAARVYVAVNGRRQPGREPHPGRSVEYAAWRIGAVLERERAELAALYRMCLELRRGQQELVAAYVEHLIWVEFDPFSVRPHPDDTDGLGLDPQALERFGVVNRNDLCHRATDLRRFADERTGTVSPRTWQRMGGYRVVRAAALTQLAGEPLARGRTSTPTRPRLGRRRAWEHARTWVADIAPIHS